MTPEERQLISGLFDRMRQQGAGMKDRDAEAFIQDAIRRMPDTPYMLVQTTLVQEMALQQSEARIQELEQQVRDLESRGQPQQSSGSFLGGLFGGGAAPRPSSVPQSGRQQSAGFSTAPRGPAPGPWGNTGASAPQGGYGQPMPQQQMPMQQASGGGFMRNAMTTAAGVAGGMLAANAISNMLGGHTAQAAGAGLTGAQSTAATGHHGDAVDHAGTQASNDDNDPGNSDDNDPGYDDAGGGDAGGGWDE